MANDIERERHILDLLDRSLALPGPEQRDYLVSQSADDPVVMERVLRIYDTVRNPQRAFAKGGALAYHEADQVPERVGAYRILGEIGRGGMGIVCHGQRTDDDFEHEVAIKIVRREAASDRLVQRLRAERRALASLRHPGITQFYDGGELEDGRPYFIMEFVENGLTLDRYIAGERPDTDARLDIFLKVCDAVGYAHQNLIIHRDLAPSNILITESGQPKLIDFGISHVLSEASESDAANLSRLTRTAGYAAPERLSGQSSTLSDIYSLGVILRDLSVDSKAARMADLRQVIARATAPDPEDRYGSVDALVGDIIAYREGRAVAAAGISPVYLLRRFVGRHWLPFTMAATLFVGMAVAGATLWMLLLRAQSAEQRAVERFEDVRALAGFMMFDLHEDIRKLDGATVVREKLVKTSLDYLEALSGDPERSDKLTLEIAAGLKHLSEVTGSPWDANRGLRHKAEPLLERSLGLVSRIYEDRPMDPSVVEAYASVLMTYATFQGTANNDNGRAFELAMLANEALISVDDSSFAIRLLRADAKSLLGQFAMMERRHAEATELLEDGKVLFSDLVAERPGSIEARLGQAKAAMVLARTKSWEAYYEAGHDESYDDAGQIYLPTLPYFDEAIEFARETVRLESSTATKDRLIRTLLQRANTTCYVVGHQDAALADIDEARQLVQELTELDPSDNRLYELLTTAHIMNAACYSHLGRHREAIQSGTIAIQRRRNQLSVSPENPEHLRNLVNSIWAMTEVYTYAGQRDRACELAQEIERIYSQYSSSFQQDQHSLDTEIAGTMAYIEECRSNGGSPAN